VRAGSTMLVSLSGVRTDFNTVVRSRTVPYRRAVCVINTQATFTNQN